MFVELQKVQRQRVQLLKYLMSFEQFEPGEFSFFTGGLNYCVEVPKMWLK